MSRAMPKSPILATLSGPGMVSRQFLAAMSLKKPPKKHSISYITYLDETFQSPQINEKKRKKMDFVLIVITAARKKIMTTFVFQTNMLICDEKKIYQMCMNDYFTHLCMKWFSSR